MWQRWKIWERTLNILDFKLSPCSECFLLGNSHAGELPRRKHTCVNNYPTSCNNIQLIYICKLLYMFRVVSPPETYRAVCRYKWTVYCCIFLGNYWHILCDARTIEYKIHTTTLNIIPFMKRLRTDLTCEMPVAI